MILVIIYFFGREVDVFGVIVIFDVKDISVILDVFIVIN